MKIVCLSDTHELHRTVRISQGGDLLIHAGDFTFFCERTSALRDFNSWLGELPFRHKVVVPGNHERIMHERPALRRLITNATLLINEPLTADVVKLWGSPVTCDDEAFGCETAEDRRKLYSSIPEGTDIVITHGPPQGILDVEYRSKGVHRGCPELLAAVQRVKPQIHIFGHVHASHGAQRVGETAFVNAAMLGWAGDLDKRPVAFNFPLKETARRDKTGERG